MRIGVVSFQGAFREHTGKLRALGAQPVEVRNTGDLSGLRGIIIPGGESTVIGRFLHQTGLSQAIKDRVIRGEMALMGTCAGAILACRRTSNCPPQGAIDIFPAKAERNAYGTQKDSFQDNVLLWDGRRIPGVFIRAPRLSPMEGASVLGMTLGEPVMMSWERCLILSFHPELTDDNTVHELFLKMSRHGKE